MVLSEGHRSVLASHNITCHSDVWVNETGAFYGMKMQ